MLAELRVKDLGIIEEINWNLSRGLNVITGETGAGKSLVIDAVEALLTGIADEDVIRYGADEARIEGVFALPQGERLSPLGELLAENGLPADEESLIIECQLRRQGRRSVRVNGHAVPRGLVSQIGGFLIDIHGQSQHLSLRDKKYQLYFLDSYAHTLDRRHSFRAKASQLRDAEEELKKLIEQEKELARREEFLRFQLDEITQARLQDGEQEELEREGGVLSSMEQLKAFSYEAAQALSGGDDAPPPTTALDRLNEAVQLMKKLVGLDPTLKRQLDFLEETSYGLEELARDLHAYSDRLEYDPKRLEEIEARLELIRGLKRKYGRTITEVLDYLKRAEVELAGLAHSSERLTELAETRSRLKTEMGRIAADLSRQRSRAARKLVTEVKKELQDLNMSQVEFEVSITREPAEEGISFPSGESYAFSNEGVDSVEFLASTNPGEPLKPVAKIASTGEISRFMLALKGALSLANNIPVLIFDEIDIGVGGRSGEIIGKKLWALARNCQVICVTHLPQIAAFADAHYSVHKASAGTRTLSTLQNLEDEPRLEELAVMLGGARYTETALSSARELVQKAETWKAAHNMAKQ